MTVRNRNKYKCRVNQFIFKSYAMERIQNHYMLTHFSGRVNLMANGTREYFED